MYTHCFPLISLIRNEGLDNFVREVINNKYGENSNDVIRVKLYGPHAIAFNYLSALGLNRVVTGRCKVTCGGAHGQV